MGFCNNIKYFLTVELFIFLTKIFIFLLAWHVLEIFSSDCMLDLYLIITTPWHLLHAQPAVNTNHLSIQILSILLLSENIKRA